MSYWPSCLAKFVDLCAYVCPQLFEKIYKQRSNIWTSEAAKRLFLIQLVINKGVEKKEAGHSKFSASGNLSKSILLAKRKGGKSERKKKRRD